MKKSHQIFTIGFVVALFIAVGVGVYFHEGQDMRQSHYIRLELNPKIEFLTDNDNIVNTVYPVNEDARLVIAGEDFVGLEVGEACAKFLDLCVTMGYIDVDGNSNGVQISVSSGFTQSLENKIYKACNNYFLENEITCVIAESDADRKLFEEKNEKKVLSIEKLVVIKAILEKTDDYSFEELNKKTESELLDIIETEHAKIQEDIDNQFTDELQEKEERLNEYKEKYDLHISKITDDTKREFSEKYAKFKKSATYEYELDFAKKLKENNS